MKTNKPNDQEMVEFGMWAIWAFRQPNALELFRERGARCEHGPVCEECLAESRTRVAQMANNQEESQA